MTDFLLPSIALWISLSALLFSFFLLIGLSKISAEIDECTRRVNKLTSIPPPTIDGSAKRKEENRPIEKSYTNISVIKVGELYDFSKMALDRWYFLTLQDAIAEDSVTFDEQKISIQEQLRAYVANKEGIKVLSKRDYSTGRFLFMLSSM